MANYYEYVKTDGTMGTVYASSPQEAIQKAPDRKSDSGVMLSSAPQQQPAQQTTPTKSLTPLNETKTETKELPQYDHDKPVERINNLSSALNVAVDEARKQRQDATLDFLGGVLPPGALPATSFAGVLQAFKSNQRPLETSLLNNASSFAIAEEERRFEEFKMNQPSFDVVSVPGGGLIELERDATGQVINQNVLREPEEDGLSATDLKRQDEQTLKEAIPIVRERLSNSGGIGNVDVGTYQWLKTDYISLGGQAAEFDRIFASYLSPQDRQTHLNTYAPKASDDDGFDFDDY